jgi:hypothetical protein
MKKQYVLTCSNINCKQIILYKNNFTFLRAKFGSGLCKSCSCTKTWKERNKIK